jgi:hypothetical protein
MSNLIADQYGLTYLESVVLFALAHDECNALNGGKLTDEDDASDLTTWAGCRPIIQGYSVQRIIGTMGSLTRKGMIRFDGEGRDELMTFSDEAFAFALEVETSTDDLTV